MDRKLQAQYMKRAMELAERGRGATSPNPVVGCVVVKDGRVIGEGYHERYGAYHAERNALLSCAGSAEGADLYVTLEPCCHYGKTPPCTEIIIEKKIGRVFVGSRDPNPKVSGKGLQILREHGIAVTTGILEEECRKMNEVFFHFITTKMPFVLSKFAMTLDGKIACASGDSRWVTGEEARCEVQTLRKDYSGIMVGIGTVLADDPMLNCRMEEGADPVRIICDSFLRIPLESRIVRSAKEIPTIVAAAKAPENPKGAAEDTGACPATEDGGKGFREKEEALKVRGVEVLHTSLPGRVDLKELMKILGEKGIDSVLLEGGGELNAAAYQARVVNKVQAYIACKIVGGKGAKTPVAGKGALTMGEAISLKDVRAEMVGCDVRITGYPLY